MMAQVTGLRARRVRPHLRRRAPLPEPPRAGARAARARRRGPCPTHDASTPRATDLRLRLRGLHPRRLRPAPAHQGRGGGLTGHPLASSSPRSQTASSAATAPCRGGCPSDLKRSSSVDPGQARDHGPQDLELARQAAAGRDNIVITRQAHFQPHGVHARPQVDRRGQHAAGLSKSTTRVGRRGGPSLMVSSTPPRETLPECLRRLVAAVRRVSRLGTSPTWCWPTRAADIRSRCSARAAAALERLTYSDDRRAGAAAHGALLGVLAAAGIAADCAAARRGPAWTAALTAPRRSSRSAARRWLAPAPTWPGCCDGDDVDGARGCCRRCADATRPSLDDAGIARAAAGVGRREHLRRAGGAAVVGRARRGARAARLPRCQHPRRDDRPPVAALRPVRLGRSTIRRRANYLPARVTGVLVAICAPVARWVARERRYGAWRRDAAAASQPQRRRGRGGVRRCARGPAGWADAIRAPPGDPADARRRAGAADLADVVAVGAAVAGGAAAGAAARAVGVSAACRSGRRVSPRR